ncbi:MAG: cytochrome C [Pseudomonadota bacterium]|nr:cytochrome C [Pseudomonadota bacterium]
MNKLLLLCIVFAAPAFAQDDVANLVIEKRCNACHEKNAASLGPPWQAIAARHAARKELMVDVLASKIVHGGGGNWGNVPMVPNQRVSLDEARRMAAWILDLPAGN